MKCSKLILHLVAGGLVVFLIIASGPASAQNLTLTFDAGAYRVVELPGGQQKIEMEGFTYTVEPGKPMLPSKSFLVALPPGAEVNSVIAQPLGRVQLDGIYRIQPATAQVPTSSDPKMTERFKQEWRDNYEATYSSDQAYPEQNGLYAGTGGLRKYTYATIIFCPFTYHPQSGRLEFTQTISVSIDYTPGSPDDPKMPRRLHDTSADRRAEELFVNFDQARGWYTPTSPEPVDMAITDYLVIVADELEDYDDELCENFFVCANMGWVASHTILESTPGADAAEKIRNYLIDALDALNFEFLLIIGDIDEIPMRQTFPAPDFHYPTSPYCPFTDYYYADLTGDWDSDGDGYYGEYGQDNVDFTPEIHVGRIPFNDYTTVSRILDNIHGFDYDEGNWKNNALLMGAIIHYENEDESEYPRTDGAVLMESMISGIFGSFTNTTMYEAEGLDPSYYVMDYALNHDNVQDQWTTGDYGIINWFAHGNEYGSSRKWWDFDDGDLIPEAAEMGFEQVIGTSDAPSLGSDNKPICFGTSCLNSSPAAANLGKSLLNNDASAAVIAPMGISIASAGWDEPSDGGAASYTWYYFDYVLNNDQRLGNALTSTRIQYANNFLFWYGWPAALNLYDFCLYGNPYTLFAGEPGPCCDLRGDVDDSQQVDVLDIDYFIDYLYRSGPAPICEAEADVDGSGQVDVLDVDYFIDFLYRSGSPLVPCP